MTETLNSNPPPSSNGGKWLLVLGLGALYLGIFLALPGLIWSRRLRPFDKWARAGYWLCWIALVALPVVSFYWVFLSGVRTIDPQGATAQLGSFVICAAIWLSICWKYIARPCRTVGGALLTAFCGTLLLGPLIVPSMVPTAFPLIVGLPLTIQTEWLTRGETAMFTPVWLYASSLLLAFQVFPAYLAVYWPARKTAPAAAPATAGAGSE